MRAAARASIAGVGAAACLAFAAPAAQASVESAPAAGDPQTTFTINGNTLTVESRNPIVLEVVRGSTVYAECDRVLAPHVKIVTGLALVRWGDDAASVAFPLRRVVVGVVRKVIPKISTCALDWDTGGAYPMPYATEVSEAPFTAYWRRRLARAPSPGPSLADALLGDAWNAILYWLPARYRNPWPILAAFPPAPALTHMVNARWPRTRLRYARTLAGMKVPGVAYVIGRGTTTKRLELATIGLDGKRYTYRTHVGPYIGGKFGLG